MKAGASFPGREISIVQTLWGKELGIGRVSWSIDKGEKNRLQRAFCREPYGWAGGELGFR